MLQEGNNAWGPARVYVQGNRIDETVWSYNTFTGEQAFHQYDARGHCTLLTDRSGNILEQYEYDAFGQPYFFDATGNSIGAHDAQGRWAGYSLFGNRFLFTGREWLSDLKVYDYRNRMYQPELGRFMQPDPKQFAAGDYNLYRYCHNDPVNKNDPTGLTFLVREDQKQLWKAVKEYLRKDPGERKIIDRLDKPDVKVRIDFVKDKVSGAVFDPKLAVRWNPYSAVRSRETGARLSPAIILGHELDHIYQGIFNPEAYRSDHNAADAKYENREERRVITGSEASMLRTFFNEGPRPDYKIEPYEVSDPFKR